MENEPKEEDTPTSYFYIDAPNLRYVKIKGYDAIKLGKPMLKSIDWTLSQNSLLSSKFTDILNLQGYVLRTIKISNIEHYKLHYFSDSDLITSWCLQASHIKFLLEFRFFFNLIESRNMINFCINLKDTICQILSKSSIYLSNENLSNEFFLLRI